jgi:DNA-directed RNA polymerase subunit M/transcription elongation factor TFIIS
MGSCFCCVGADALVRLSTAAELRASKITRLRPPWNPTFQTRERWRTRRFSRVKKIPCRYIIPTTVESLDPALEYLRIADRYRQMSDEELLIIARQPSELTDAAQQALASEVQSRGLKVDELDEEPPPSPFEMPPSSFEDEFPDLRDSSDDEPESSYDEDRKLVELCTVWSVRDALQVQEILDVAGIPFFMGPEKATGVDAVTSNFANGVSVQIMQVGRPWAALAMKRYEPADDPTPKGEDDDEILVRCPRCQSTEVTFEGLIPKAEAVGDDSDQKFKWTCDSCGNTWEDDGTVKKI